MRYVNCRTTLVTWLSTLTLVLLAAISARGQDAFEEAVKQLSSDNVRGYIQPFVNAFGANLNSGVYHSASATEGFHMDVRLVATGTLIGDAEKSFYAVPPDPFDPTPVKTATVFGDRGTIVTGLGGVQYQFQNGQVKTDFVPLAVPQLTLGNIYGTQAIVRYVGTSTIGDIPRITLFGIGAEHSASQYISEFPVDLAAGVFYQNLTIGNIIDAKTFNLSAQLSKSFSVLTLYGGMQYETSSMTLYYTYTGYVPPGVPPNPSITLEFEGENKFRTTAGLGLDLFVFHLNADISVGKVTVVSGGLGLGF